MTPGRTVGAAFATGRNNFDAMRLAAALLVLASHAWVLTGRAAEEPFAPLLGHLADGGGLAVGVFFVLSGFLIARSAEVHPVRSFVRARVLRVYPAFIIVVLFQVLLLGPVLSGLGARAYLTQAATWTALARALVFSPAPGLPGVFEGNPLPGVVNGSLWTLRVEVACYAGLLMLSRMGLLRARTAWLPLGVAWAALVAVLLAQAGVLPAWLASLTVLSLVQCGLNFMLGAALWVFRDRVPLRLWLVLAGVTATALASRTSAGPVLFHATLAYAVLWLGLAWPVADGLLRRVGDVSYGTYLVAFPVQQMLVSRLDPGPLALIVAAVPLTLALAWVLRRLVEDRALRWRHA